MPEITPPNLADEGTAINTHFVRSRDAMVARADFGPEGFVKALATLREECGPERLITFARAISTPEQWIVTLTLGEATPDMADMRTVVILGNSATRRVGRFVYSPRSVG